MSESEAIIVRIDDEVLFRLHKGRRPLVYPDMISRVSYETGVNVVHVGTIWGIGELDGVMALELDDGTIVATDDIDLDSVVVNPTAAIRQVEP